MTKDEARSILGISKQASIEDTETAYGDAINYYNALIRDAVNPKLRKLYQEQLFIRTEAYKVLSTNETISSPTKDFVTMTPEFSSKLQNEFKSKLEGNGNKWKALKDNNSKRLIYILLGITVLFFLWWNFPKNSYDTSENKTDTLQTTNVNKQFTDTTKPGTVNKKEVLLNSIHQNIEDSVKRDEQKKQDNEHKQKETTQQTEVSSNKKLLGNPTRKVTLKKTKINGKGSVTTKDDSSPKTICTRCNASGFIKILCSNCGGKGKLECVECSGTGNHECVFCHGDGQCNKCDGNGWKTSSSGFTYQCLVCKGSGECIHCDGKGYDRDCRVCHGKKKIFCDFCYGSGRIDDTCPTCRGKKYL
jgi:hypothetical protein